MNTYNSVEDASLVALGASVAVLILAGTESPKVFCCCRHNIYEKLQLYAAYGLTCAELARLNLSDSGGDNEWI